MKPASRQELIRRLRKVGFEGPFPGGKHSFMRRGNFKLRIPNPHGSDIEGPKLSRILREAGISEVEWDKLADK